MSASTATVEAERPQPPFPAAVVEDALKYFDKAVRAHQLYLHNNPTYHKAVENARQAFKSLWERTDSLVFQVTDTQFKWYGVPVMEVTEKAGDSIPWLLFKDGLRELALFPGFEEDELVGLLEIIQRVRRASVQEDDLLTLLWEQDFGWVRYRYVELSDPSAPLEGDFSEPGRWPAPAGAAFEPPQVAVLEAKREVVDGAEEPTSGAGEGASTAPRPAGIVRMEDFDSTLYFLEEKEIEYLRVETQREYGLDLRRLVLCSLLDIFELQSDPLVRDEVAGDLEALVLHLLSAGQFSTVAFLLRELEGVMQRARELRPQDRERLGQLPDRLSQSDALQQLLQALEEAQALPPAEDLSQLFAQLKPIALGGILGWIGRSQNARLRPILESSAERLAQSNTGELVRLIGDPDPIIAREAIRRSGGMRNAAAVPALGKVMIDGDRDSRTSAVAALADIGSAGALQALEKGLDDPDRDIRVATIRALAARNHRPALARVEALLRGKEIKDADRTERLALFELYGLLCGDAGVPFLDGILNAKGGLFGRKEDPELRACAAVGLGRVGTATAQRALERAMGEKDVIVRNAVNRALRGGATT